MSISAPPALSQQDADVKYVQFTAPDISLGQSVVYTKGGKRFTGFVEQFASDGGLNVVIVTSGLVKLFKNVYHKDDPRQTGRRMADFGCWELPPYEAARRKAMEALAAELSELRTELNQLKKKRTSASGSDAG